MTYNYLNKDYEKGLNILEIKDLKVSFKTSEGLLEAVNGVNISIGAKKTVGLVGESGSGKSVAAKAILKLIPDNAVTSGQILYRDIQTNDVFDVLGLKNNSRKLRELRGNKVSMIFQDPMTSFSPVHTIGNQLCEAVMIHQPNRKYPEVWKHCTQMLEKVGISNPEHRMGQYVAELSGGMRQRAMIAMSLSCSPSLLIADEPTTALDVTIQAQVLDLIDNLKDEFDSSVLFITHDLGVIANSVEEVAVMYLGKIVEFGSTREIFDNPMHPYTQDLMKSIPHMGKTKGQDLYTIPGNVPIPIGLPDLCPYVSRCLRATDSCRERKPQEQLIDNKGHRVSCLLYENE